MRKWIPFFFLFLTLIARAQTFTNSATLSASIDGTNLVIAYSLANTQGWVTLFQADRPETLLTQSQPVDYAPAPVTSHGQFRVPLDPASPTKFYRLLLEQWLSRGKALVFIDGPVDFAAMRQTYGDITNLSVVAYTNQFGGLEYTNQTTPIIFKPPVEVWLDHLGVYDPETGVHIGDNSGMLNGKYGNTAVLSIENSGGGFPRIGRLQSNGGNDFRVFYDGSGSVPKRDAVIWSTEAQMYYDMTHYRTTLLNDSFIRELHLPTEMEQNLINRQYRPDLNMGSTPRSGNPILQAYENASQAAGIELYPRENGANVHFRTRGPGYSDRPPISVAYDSGFTLGDFAGLMAFWVLGSDKGFPSDAFYGDSPQWTNNILAPLNDGLSIWVGHRFTGNTEVYKYAHSLLSG